MLLIRTILFVFASAWAGISSGQTLPELIPYLEPAPLSTSVIIVASTLADLGSPLAPLILASLQSAIKKMDAEGIQQALDSQVLLVVTLNPEGRAKIARGPVVLNLTQDRSGYAVVKVVNQSGGQQLLRAHADYEGASPSPFRVEVVDQAKHKPDLTGQLVEYRLLRITCNAAGKHEVSIGFDIGQGTQDLGFRGETAVLFQVRTRP